MERRGRVALSQTVEVKNLCFAARLVVLGKLLNISESFCEEDNYRVHLTRLW